MKRTSLVLLTLLFCAAGAADQEIGGDQSAAPRPDERMLMDLLDLSHQIGHRQGGGEIDAEQAEDLMRRNRRMAGEILAMAQSRGSGSASDAANIEGRLEGCHQDLRETRALLLGAELAGSKDREECQERIDGARRRLEATMERLSGCRQKLQETQNTLERIKEPSEAAGRNWKDEAQLGDIPGGNKVRVPDRRARVRVVDPRGKVDIWDAGVFVWELGGPSDDKSETQALQPPATVPGGEVRRWFERHNRELGTLVRLAWSEEEAEGFFAKESRNCEGNLYCRLSARQQAISLALSRP